MNPDFVPWLQGRVGRELLVFVESWFRPFHSRGYALIWIRKFTPQPQRLIVIWEDYAFMSVCENLWLKEACDFLEPTEQLSNNGPDILSQVSLDADMLRILYAYKVTVITPHVGSSFLFSIRRLLGLSWDELRAAICALREILGGDITRYAADESPNLDSGRNAGIGNIGHRLRHGRTGEEFFVSYTRHD
ncbi:hypothetical protein FB451DRAFT_125982 [Mycena latifolia]|nr:hypothetical protein FB451DRAFT_125982 [Mycena latifolia]